MFNDKSKLGFKTPNAVCMTKKVLGHCKVRMIMDDTALQTHIKHENSGENVRHVLPEKSQAKEKGKMEMCNLTVKKSGAC